MSLRVRARVLRCAALLLCLLAGVQANAAEPVVGFGDRGEAAYGRMELPDAAVATTVEAAQGGLSIIDVRAFGADPAPGNDDTEALIRAYSYVVDRMRPYRDVAQKPFDAPSDVLYLPDGEYRVSRTLVYDGEPIDWKGRFLARRNGDGEVMENLVRVRIVGQSRSGTILRLADQADGFGDPAHPRPVLAFGRRSYNNVQANNVVRNLTIDVGQGNPGAIGLAFSGANNSNVRNVTLRGDGAVGLDVAVPPTQGYWHDLTIDGFDTGLRLATPQNVTQLSLEYLTLRNQRRVGIELGGNALVLRQVRQTGPASVPLLRITDAGAVAAIVASQSEGGIERGGDGKALGALLVDHSIIAGQRIVGRLDGASLDGNVFARSWLPGRLPVEEWPIAPWSGPASWAVVRASGGDDYERLAAALAGAQPNLLLVSPHYCIELRDGRTPLQVPASIQRIVGSFSTIRSVAEGTCAAPKQAGTTFAVMPADATASPLRIEDLNSDGGSFVVHRGARPVLISQAMTQGVLFRHVTDDRMKLRLANVNGFGKTPDALHHVDAWARFINTETAGPVDFELDDATLWVLGFKTEKIRTAFRVRNSTLEVVGGTVNQFEQAEARRQAKQANGGEEPVVIDFQSGRVDAFIATHGPDSDEGFQHAVREPRGRLLKWSDFPVRPGPRHQIVLPLSMQFEPDDENVGP